MKMILKDFREIHAMKKDKTFYLRTIYNIFNITEEIVSVEELTKILTKLKLS